MNVGNFGIVIKDNKSKEWREAFDKAWKKGLEEIGLTAEGYAKLLCRVDTGNLRNSITHKIDESDKSLIIGTNVEYAPFVELGTGVHYSGGRKGGWWYCDSEGEFHFTYGSKPYPFLKPAVTEHIEEYKALFESAIKN